MIKRIAVLGDFNPDYHTHHALNETLRDTVHSLKSALAFDWIATDKFDFTTAFESYSGVLIAPGSPYRDMENVLNTIAYTRKHNIPTFGNCGGFQHMIIELARNVCGIRNADHEETNPEAEELLISKLACSLVGMEENLTIPDKNTLLYKILQTDKLIGRYHCSYGINADYIDILKSKGLIFTAFSDDGSVRAFELKDHPFFLGTLFQPALTSGVNQPDPLFIEFAVKSIEYAKRSFRL